MASPAWRVIVLLSLAAAAGCSGRSSAPADAATDVASRPDRAVTDPRAAICPSADAASAPPTYAQIQEIFDSNCVTCHNVGATLNLSAGVSWGNLVNQPAPDPDGCGGTLVAPGDANGSYLYQKVSSPTPCYGAQMPLGEFFSDPLPACVVAMIEQWIAAGAPGLAADAGGN